MTYKVEMKHITKVFGSLNANDDVSIAIKKGEIHAILGENGAGKSTLMSILFGLYKPESGEIFYDGEKVEINNPNDANRLGIGMVHQHFKLVEAFRVIENIVLGQEDVVKKMLSFEKARAKIENLIQLYGLKVNLDSYIKDISVGQQQRVEILKMLYRESDVLIFDEPTAVLTPQEVRELIQIMRGFAKEGKTIILITHKLNEIKQVADRCTVLRRGKMIKTFDVKDYTIGQMAEMMVGRDISFEVNKDDITPGKKVLEVKHLSVFAEHKNLVNNVSFDVHEGEIVGIAGIDGNGQTELIQSISGLRPFQEGTILLEDKDISKASIRKKYELGVAHIPEDRQKHGVILDFDLASNLILQNFYTKQFQKAFFLRFDQISQHADDLIERFDIRSEKGAKTTMRSMSGGNQQKSIVAREIEKAHKLLIAVQPTRGLDVGAIEYIHSQLLHERKEGKAILMVSLEIDEVIDISDRILVMYEGEIVANVLSKDTNVNELGLFMLGEKRGEGYGRKAKEN
ncbi:MAG: ABC transporter ATP-binding protein [Acholeplasmataceae bacterium]|nr:ABC transporter ATP-binding protein [Acholeplasmataceae bacterium]